MQPTKKIKIFYNLFFDVKSSKIHCAVYTHSTYLCVDKPHFKSSKAVCASGCRPRGFNSRLCWKLPLPFTAGFRVGNGPGRAPCWGFWDKPCLWAPSAWGLGGMVFKPAWASCWATLALPTGTPRPTAQPRWGQMPSLPVVTLRGASFFPCCCSSGRTTMNFKM